MEFYSGDWRHAGVSFSFQVKMMDYSLSIKLEECKVFVMYFCFILFLNLMFVGVFCDWIMVGFLLSFGCVHLVLVGY